MNHFKFYILCFFHLICVESYLSAQENNISIKINEKKLTLKFQIINNFDEEIYIPFNELQFYGDTLENNLLICEMTPYMRTEIIFYNAKYDLPKCFVDANFDGSIEYYPKIFSINIKDTLNITVEKKLDTPFFGIDSINYLFKVSVPYSTYTMLEELNDLINIDFISKSIKKKEYIISINDDKKKLFSIGETNTKNRIQKRLNKIPRICFLNRFEFTGLLIQNSKNQ